MAEIRLRGIARQEGGYWVAVELTCDVIGTGDDETEAVSCCINLASRYLRMGGKKDRAPVVYWLRYWWWRLTRGGATWDVKVGE